MYQKIDIKDLAQYGNLELLARQVVEGFITGLHKSPYHGFSVEFAEHRLYNPGESTKHIDWKLYARTDKMFVKRYEEETNLRCQIILDVSSSMYFPNAKNGKRINKIGYSIYAIASLITLLKKQRDAFGLSIFSDQVHFHSDVKSSAGHQRMLFGQMEKWLQPQSSSETGTEMIDTLHQVAELVHKRSLIILFSDFMNFGKIDEMMNAIGHMKHNKHEIIIFRVVDQQKEMDLNYDNRIHEFVDMESGERIKMNPVTYQKVYREQQNNYEQKLREKLEEYSVDYNIIDIDEDIRTVLSAFMIKRQKMH